MKKKDLYYERIPTKLLREDVKYLGNILGKVIKIQEGQKFFDLVEKIRKLSKTNKKSPNQKKLNSKLLSAIKNLNPKNTYKLTRAFSHFMNFMNLAELVDASRSLNEHENSQKKLKDNKNLFIEEIFEDLFSKKNISNNKIYDLAKNLNKKAYGAALKPFRYKDKGTMATIGRNKAVVDLPFWKFSGFFGWITWMFVHLMLLVDYRSRLVVFVDWVYSYLRYDKGTRLIVRKVGTFRKQESGQ